MTTTKAFPTSPSEITADWLTEALRNSGAIRSATVTSFDAKVIGEGAGFMGQLAKLSITYDRPEPDAPAAVIGKFPAAFRENREVAMFFRFYEREVNFYEQIAQRVSLRVPRCYFSAFDAASGDYALLLQDMAPATIGDQLAGCPAERAALCIRELATFHAMWWESPELANFDWMPAIDAEWYRQAVVKGYSDAWGPFDQYFGDKLSPRIRAVAEQFVNHIDPFMTYLASPPVTIVHADYRLDNLFFGDGTTCPRLGVIDWQITVRGRGTFDVAYFTGGTMAPEERKEAERDLLKLYHETLEQGGVRGYSFDQCWEDYRRSILFMIVYAVIAIGSLDLANERGVELFTTVLDRTAHAIEDLDADEFIR
jgi:aminoglycoside/choline kinase family phosphotransferase